ncbi:MULTISPECIES: hypothetical protein [Dickeya]|uniref:hypothetical protein n=1 Tax=Dickeya TaxID=204037 RepID=UPI0003A577F3|nr:MULTISPECIES: hypothetical protein [Dickeya]UGA51559.1 hypothetical protein QR68_02590 [Dickeya fangzhongdai]UWH07908.1 hypothetical protein K0H75_02585 [Dickeya fangzhongdai]
MDKRYIRLDIHDAIAGFLPYPANQERKPQEYASFRSSAAPRLLCVGGTSNVAGNSAIRYPA